MSNDDLGRDAHWFDGDGMLSGVFFSRTPNGSVQPKFVNQYILTDVYLHTTATPSLQRPILPSIATLTNPMSSLLQIMVACFRAIVLVFLSKMPGSPYNIRKISVANTSIMYHDGRALATCESGPPMRVQLPSLESIGWYNGCNAEGEAPSEDEGEVFGGKGELLSFMKEWTTAHPKVDPVTNEMILFHSTFAPPFVHYTILPPNHQVPPSVRVPAKLMNQPIRGITSAKMIHDFGVGRLHTVMMDLPLSLDPLRLARNEAPICYDTSEPARFGVFPRREPDNVRWFETSACCIFHTANTWDVFDSQSQLESVDMLACRQTSAAVVFSAGNIAAPPPKGKKNQRIKTIQFVQDEKRDPAVYQDAPLLEEPLRTDYSDPGDEEEDQCRLYYYSFDMKETSQNRIKQQYALSRMPFEFPSVRADREMSSARYVYGCTTCVGSFNTALGRAAKIDGLVKFDVRALIERGKRKPPTPVTGCVDNRSVEEILAANERDEPDQSIQIFRTPPGWCAQEPRFVAREGGTTEDDGYLVTYMFDESQLGEDGEPIERARSELWVLDARDMKTVVAKIQLPQRVPYGLHGSWFAEPQVLGQRPVESVRRAPTTKEIGASESALDVWSSLGKRLREAAIGLVGR